MVAISNCAGISAPFLFPASTLPMFSMGNWIIFGFMVISMGLTLCAWYVFGSSSGYRGEPDVSKDEEAGQATIVEPQQVSLSAISSSETLAIGVIEKTEEKEVAGAKPAIEVKSVTRDQS